jgi:hypothetical protein
MKRFGSACILVAVTGLVINLLWGLTIYGPILIEEFINASAGWKIYVSVCLSIVLLTIGIEALNRAEEKEFQELLRESAQSEYYDKGDEM